MSVNPGFGGQSFNPVMFHKIEELKEWREYGEFNFLIQVDGGVGVTNARELEAAGVDVLVAGTAVFGAEDRASAIKEIKGS